jgi:hypothetical protein
MTIKLLSMAYPKAKAEDIVLAQSDGLELHLLKILRAPDHSSAAHWCQEVNSFLGKANRAATNVKTASGYLSKNSVESLLLPNMDNAVIIRRVLNGGGIPRDLFLQWFPTKEDVTRFAERTAVSFDSGLRDLIVSNALLTNRDYESNLTIEGITSFSK